MKVYVSTFHKYNNGSLRGDWIDIEGHDRESFLDACRELHSDEVDPELMFQSWEGVPNPLASESSLAEELWEFIELREDEREIVAAYWEECTGFVTPIQEALDAFIDKHDSQEEFAEWYCRECYSETLDKLPSWLVQSIDWQMVWNATLHYQFMEGNGFYFSRE
jgi:antirestriction protein